MICPIMSKPDSFGYVECQKEKCGFYNTQSSNCSVAQISIDLNYLSSLGDAVDSTGTIRLGNMF